MYKPNALSIMPIAYFGPIMYSIKKDEPQIPSKKTHKY